MSLAMFRYIRTMRPNFASAVRAAETLEKQPSADAAGVAREGPPRIWPSRIALAPLSMLKTSSQATMQDACVKAWAIEGLYWATTLDPMAITMTKRSNWFHPELYTHAGTPGKHKGLGLSLG